MTIAATTFAFHVTYTCPLACAHCCFLSSPQVRDSLDPGLILDSIATLPNTIGMVAFTGGEPFLHGAHLAAYVRAAKARGFVTRIVTSAYFGRTPAAASKRLAEVVDAGLDELSISWDDFHEEFVAFGAVRNVVEAGLEFGLTVAINSVQVATSHWTRQRILDELGSFADRITLVTESTLNLTGRAEEKLAGSALPARGFLGPCPYVLTGPTLGAKGNLLACCGVIPEASRLVLAHGVQPMNLRAEIAKGFSNPLLLWLFLRGPYALVEEIAARLGRQPPDRETIGGNCEACRILLTDPVYETQIDDVLADRLVLMANELLLLESIGQLSPRGLQTLWGPESLVRVGL